MRRAIISDIHGNWIALQAVLHDIAAQKVDDVVCLGDMVGFGPDVVECCDLVMKHCAWSLAGNHDLTLFADIHDFNDYARKAINYARAQLRPHWYSSWHSRRRWSWLKNLQPQRKEGSLLFVHGSPRDPYMEFTIESDFSDVGLGATVKATEIFSLIEDVCFCGHSHTPGVVTPQKGWARPQTLPDGAAAIGPRTPTLVNVGSVGQPRDRDPRSCYVIWDDTARTVQFRRIPYDLAATQKRFERVALFCDSRYYHRLLVGQ